MKKRRQAFGLRSRRSRARRAAPIVDPIESAKSAGLLYVRDEGPGIRREMGPLGFKYLAPDGRIIRNAATLKRLRALAVPPAWTDVWICPDPHGHIQATGRDARGRKQYRYHAAWRIIRDETKYDRMLAFADALPVIRSQTRADLMRPGLPREKVLATVVQLLEKSFIRIGNDEYARHNRSFGLTTMRNRHVAVKGHTLRFEFRGKSGKQHCVDVNDRHLASIVRQCRELPGYKLFQYIDDHTRRQEVDSADVNAYLKEITGEDFTAKDFRTWAGTVLTTTALRELAAFGSQAQAKRNVVHAIEAVSKLLGNTRTVCRKSYIHPVIIDAYMDGSMHEMLGRKRKPGRLRPDEAVALSILQQRLTRDGKRRKAA